MAGGVGGGAVDAAAALQHQHAGAGRTRLDRGAGPGHAQPDDDDIGLVVPDRNVRRPQQSGPVVSGHDLELGEIDQLEDRLFAVPGARGGDAVLEAGLQHRRDLDELPQYAGLDGRGEIGDL